MTRTVVDASVAIKWFVPEEGSDDAAQLLETPSTFIAPDLIHAEIGNTLWKKVRRGELTAEEGREVLEAWRRMPVATTAIPSLLPAAFEVALALGMTVYDGLYLALAEASDSEVVTADRRLAESAAGSPFECRVRRLG